MRVSIRLFAAAKQLAGSESIVVELPAAATVAELRGAVADQFPALALLVARAMFSINLEYATDTTPVTENAEVACIPPVSGG